MKKLVNIYFALFGLLALSCSCSNDKDMVVFYFPGENEFQNRMTWQWLKQCSEAHEISDTTSVDEQVYDEIKSELAKATPADSIGYQPTLCLLIDQSHVYLDVNNNKCMIEEGDKPTCMMMTNRGAYLIKKISGFYRFYDKEHAEKYDPGAREFGYVDNAKEFTCQLPENEEEPELECIKVLVKVK